MLSVQCLISALTQAGGGDVLFSSLVQFSPAAGRAGRCRQTSLCVGSTPRVPATLGLPRSRVSVLSPSTLLRLPAALYGAGPALSAVPVFGSSTNARRLRLRVVSSPPQRFRQPEAWAPSPRVRSTFSLLGPSAHLSNTLITLIFKSFHMVYKSLHSLPHSCVSSLDTFLSIYLTHTQIQVAQQQAS